MASVCFRLECVQPNPQRVTAGVQHCFNYRFPHHESRVHNVDQMGDIIL